MEKNIETARYWFNANIEYGESDGYIELADMLFEGDDGGISEENDQAAVLYLKRAIERSDPSWATRYLSWAYREGRGVKADPKKAYSLLVRLSERGDSYAYSMRAYHLRNGIGVQRNLDKAIKNYKAAFRSGTAGAYVDLANVYLEGEHTGFVSREADGIALKYLKEAKSLGNARAVNDLGWMYDIGRFVEKDPRRALNLYQQSAKLGNARAWENLGAHYQNNKNSKDLARAINAYTSAIQNGNANGYWRLAILLKNRSATLNDDKQIIASPHIKDPEEEETKKSESQPELSEPIKRKIVNLLENGRARQNVAAINWLGVLHGTGDVVEKSEDQAITFYQQAADKGSGLAASNLFWAYVKKYNKSGSSKNLDLAIKFLNRGVELDHTSSLDMMINLYSGGEELEGSPIRKSCEQATDAYERLLRLRAKKWPYENSNLQQTPTSSPFYAPTSEDQPARLITTYLGNCSIVSESLGTFVEWLNAKDLQKFPGISKGLKDLALFMNAHRHWRGGVVIKVDRQRYEQARDYYLENPQNLKGSNRCSLFLGLLDDGRIDDVISVWQEGKELSRDDGELYYCSAGQLIKKFEAGDFSEKLFEKMLSIKGDLAYKYMYDLHFFALRKGLISKIDDRFVEAAAAKSVRKPWEFVAGNHEWGTGIIESFLKLSGGKPLVNEAIASAILEGVTYQYSASKYFALVNKRAKEFNSETAKILQRRLFENCSLKIAASDFGVDAKIDGVIGEMTIYALQLNSSMWEFTNEDGTKESGGGDLLESRCSEL